MSYVASNTPGGDGSRSPGYNCREMLVSVPYLPHPEGDRPMNPAPDPRTASALQEKLLRSIASLEQVLPTLPKRSLGQAAQDDAPPAPNTRYHQGHFDARHNLTPEQAWQAEQLLRQKTPFRGPHAQQKEAARIAGIVSSV